MPNKALIERLQSDTKRHRAPQIDILPDWAKTVEKRVVASVPETAVVQIEKNSEKGKKSEKKAKKKKK